MAVEIFMSGKQMKKFKNNFGSTFLIKIIRMLNNFSFYK